MRAEDDLYALPLLALACRGHHDLVLENLALRQQLNALKRPAAVASSGREIACFGSYWRRRGEIGARRS
jgi:hypothetical protein